MMNPPTQATLSIIIPTLNEAGQIAATLAPLQPMRGRGGEVIVADGGSEDATVAIATPLCDRVISAPRGRARQMNAGAATARGAVLWFLHADTLAPSDADLTVLDSVTKGALWGRFAVRLSGSHPALRIIERMMNLRSCLTAIATGDQGLFVRRDAFARVGGYRDLPLMEDIELSRALKRLGHPACLRQTVVTSSRRWEQHGIWRTVLLMWRLRLRWFLGADAESLARRYR